MVLFQEVELEWWKLYGDAHTYGKQKSVAIAIGNVNNEHILNGCSYQSLKEMWPVCLFYRGDSRLNLELNLDGDTSWPNNWVTSMEASGHSMFLTDASMFLDAMAATNLDPTSKDKFNIYTATYSSIIWLICAWQTSILLWLSSLIARKLISLCLLESFKR